MALSSDLDPIFDAAAKEWNVDPRLLRAVATQESAGNPRAVSSKGARGLMGIMPDTGQGLGMTDLADPVQSIYGGAKYLNEALTAEKTPAEALLYYHGGPDWRSKMGPESMGYVPAVTAHYQKLAPKAEKPTTAGGGSALPSDDDFLAATAPKAGAKPAAGDDDAAFLSRTGAQAAPPKPEEPQPWAAPVGGEFGDMSAEPWAQGPQPTGTAPVAKLLEPGGMRAALTPTPGRVYGSVLPLSADEGTGANPSLSIPGMIRSPLLGALDLLGGPKQALTFNPNTGAFGLTPDAQNALMFGATRSVASRGGAPANALALGAPAETRAIEAPASGVQPGMGAPTGEAQSVGAAASRDMSPPGVIDLSPAEMKANRRQAEMREILSPPEASDARTYVEGSLPTKAEYTGNPLVSQKETLLRQRNPEVFERRLADNNMARVRSYEDLTPSDTALQTMEARRGEQATKDTQAVLESAKTADAQPALDAMDAVLKDKRNQNRESVQRNLAPYRDRLFDADGNLKADPAELWGIRDDLTEKLDKIGSDPQSTIKYVKKEALAFRDAIDGVLNTATDGKYQTFLDNYAAASQQINAGNVLREFRSKLTNAKGDVQANRFHKFVTDLADARGEKGIDPAMDIPDETMRRLIAIDTDLKRAGLIDLGKARGSPTNLLGSLAKATGVGAAHAGLAAMTPVGIPNLLLQGALNRAIPAIEGARMRRMTQQHLAPPKGGYAPFEP